MHNLKFIFLTLPLAILCTLPLAAQDDDAVTFEITGGIESPQTLRHIETQAARLLTAINKAQSTGTAINYSGIDIDNLASQTIGMSWNQSPFRTEDPEVITFASTLKRKNGTVRGYQVRNIGMLMSAPDYPGETRQEISIDFSPAGRIVDFNFTMPTHHYVKLVKTGNQLDDLDRRLQIIHWCEQFAKAYRDKNKDFMEAIFSDDALIITGTLKMSRAKSEIAMNNGAKVEYVTKTKRQYLTSLYRIFSTQPYINVKFEDYSIVRHPAKPQYYGVTLKQHWATGTYQDVGTLFLVWDFTNEDAPKIHVRTWQPITEEAFKLNDFKLP